MDPAGVSIETKDLRDVLLRVVDANGAAVAGACTVVGSAVPGTANHLFWHERFATDRRGQQRLVFGPGRWVVYAFDGCTDGMVLVEHGGLPDTLTIELEPFPVAQYRLRHENGSVGTAGDPVVGARPILSAGIEIEDPEGQQELLTRVRQERINRATSAWLYSAKMACCAYLPSCRRAFASSGAG